MKNKNASLLVSCFVHLIAGGKMKAKRNLDGKSESGKSHSDLTYNFCLYLDSSLVT